MDIYVEKRQSCLKINRVNEGKQNAWGRGRGEGVDG